MNVSEAYERVHFLKQMLRVHAAVSEFLSGFAAVEGEEGDRMVMWLEDGGKVSQGALESFQSDLQEQRETLEEELRHLLGMDVDHE